MKRIVLITLLGVAALGTAGCRRGTVSSKPPVHLWTDMDWQPKYHAEGESVKREGESFPGFKDGRQMRPLVEGTVARGALHDQPKDTGIDPGYEGADQKGPPVYIRKVSQIQPVDKKLIERGQERFNIYCSPCHDRTGAGKGIVVQRGFFIPVDLMAEHARSLPDGEIFNIISHGVRNMPAYGYQVPAEDRWAIVTWIRVLQKAQKSEQPPEGGSK